MSDTIEQHESSADGISEPQSAHTALLICRDSASQKWGPRWLEQSGFLTTSAHDPSHARKLAREMQPSVVIVEAGLLDAAGCRLYETLHRCGRRTPLRTLVLCANAREAQIALDNPDIADIVRKPFDWNLISRRARRAVVEADNEQELNRTYLALDEARAEIRDTRRSLAHSVDRDALTGLSSRVKFKRLLDQALLDQPKLSLLVIRLNRFRLVNEALGHDNGNRVLAEISQRLRKVLGGSTSAARGLVTVAASRLGGVRFGVLVSRMNDPEDLRKLADRIHGALCQPVRIANQSVYLSSSIGAAIAPLDGEDADRLLQHADLAVREAKQRGGGFSMYREPLAAGSARHLELEGLLHEALDRGQLHIEYQPLLQVAENKVIGAEALVRWHHPVQGNISPAEFIPIAENSGLMSRIGALVIDGACRQLRQWRDAGATDLRVAINLSLYQLRHGDVVEVVARALRETQLEPRLVELELSERGVVGRDHEVLHQLHRLKALGVRLAIDDFGTGESAIAYLKELPIDSLKIDRSYLKGALSDGRDATIVAGLIALARRLGLTVVAEGVEVGEQLRMLREWGCHQYQGFYFSPAVAGNRFLALAKSADQKVNACEGRVADLV